MSLTWYTDFAGLIKLRILASEIILDYRGGLDVITRVLLRRKKEVKERKR